MTNTQIRPAKRIDNLQYFQGVSEHQAGHLLDLYLPEMPFNQQAPLIILSGGSGWMLNNGKDIAQRLAQRFTSQGYAVAGVSIRSSFQAPYPAQLHDIRAAVRWLRSRAKTYQLDPDRFAIIGQSSGGWVAAITATTSNIAQLEGELDSGGVSSAVQAAVPFFAPTDFLQMDPWYRAHPDVPSFMPHGAPFQPLSLATPPPMGTASPESLLIGAPDEEGRLLGIDACPEKAALANPIRFVDGSEPPMLLFHGDADALVPHGQSELLYEALTRAGSQVTFITVAGAGHKMSPEDEAPPGMDVGAPIISGDRQAEFSVRHGNSDSISGDAAPTWEFVDKFIAGAFAAVN